MNFAALDLNLLRVFDAMMIERNTSRAGQRIGLSQPAVSAALARLRDVARDPLFVRAGNRMIPTSRAEDLAAPVRAALAALEAAFAGTAGFDPSASDRTFRILGSDYFSTLLMPPLTPIVEREGPGLLLQMVDRGRGEPQAMLGEGLVDLMLDPAWEAPAWIASEPLFTSHLVGVTATGNPLLADIAAGDTVPPSLFASLRHAVVSIDGSVGGSLDATLARARITRRIALTLPHFHAVAAAVAGTTLFAALPVHLARRVAPRLGLALYRLPVREPRIEVRAYWHASRDADPATLWLRAKIREAWAEVERAVEDLPAPRPPAGRPQPV